MLCPKEVCKTANWVDADMCTHEAQQTHGACVEKVHSFWYNRQDLLLKKQEIEGLKQQLQVAKLYYARQGPLLSVRMCV